MTKVGVPGEEVGQSLLGDQQFALIDLLHFRVLLMTRPHPHQIGPPFHRVGLLEGILTGSQVDPGRLQARFQGLGLRRFPQLEGQGIVGGVITIMEVDQVVGPHLRLTHRIEQFGDLVKMMAVVR